MIDQDKAISATTQWLSGFVINHNLCPFAKREFESNNIRFYVVETEQEGDLLEALYREIQFLISHPDISTTLLIHPNCLVDFDQYNQFLELTEDLLKEFKWQGEYQIASFHPDYQFENTHKDDADNFTNRSPYPMLHILREAQVEKAIKSYRDIEKVPIRNIDLMNEIGASQLQSELRELQK